jgi:pimeloyl-ACP methyl ester carboxylesterase
MASTAPRSGYAPVNNLQMYYEIHGEQQPEQVPLLVLHGSFMTVELMGEIVPLLAQSRQVIAVEMQGHGHTADIDRPMTHAAMADDVAGLLRHLGLASADVYGYSLGGIVALQVAIRHPQLVRKLVVVSATYTRAGSYPEVASGISQIRPEMFDGSPWRAAYDRVAPDPAGFATLVQKVVALASTPMDWPAESVKAIPAPTLLIVGDSDGIRPEHATDFFRLRGGGVFGDYARLPASQLAILPGTTHVGLLQRADWIAPMVAAFLDAAPSQPG